MNNDKSPTLLQQLGIPNDQIDNIIQFDDDGIITKYIEYTSINYYCLIKYIGDFNNTNIIHNEISPGNH